MGLLGMGVKGTSVLFFVTAFAVYITYPPPQMSPQMLSWLTKGSFFSYEGHQIFYREERARDSSATGPTLILLHGFPTQGFDWSKMWNGLIRRFDRVIALDFLGYGFSDKPIDHEYTIMEQANIYETLLTHLGINDVHILSHDYGDTVAQELLSRFNERTSGDRPLGLHIHSICLLNGGIFKETNFPRPTQKIMLIPILGDLLSRLGNRFLFTKSLSEVFGVHTQPTEFDFIDFYAALRVKNGELVLPRLLDYIRQRSVHQDRWTRALQDSPVPVHVVWGPADPVNPSGFEQFYKKTVPKGTIAVLRSDISHYPHWEEPALVLDAYLKFIDSLTKHIHQPTRS